MSRNVPAPGRDSLSIELIDIDPNVRASLSVARRVYEGRYGRLLLIASFVLVIGAQILEAVVFRDLAGEVMTPVRAALRVVMLIGGVFVIWYVYIAGFLPIIVRFMAGPLFLVLGPLPVGSGINWRCRISRLVVPYLDATARQIAKLLARYRRLSDPRGSIQRCMTHQLTVVLLRVSVVVGLLWGSIGRDPLPLGIGCLCLLAWILIRSRGYASFSHATIWRVRLLGVGALLAAPICFAVPIAIGAGGFGLTENKHAWALWLIAALFGLGAWGAYELAIFGLGAITASGQLARRDALSELASDPRAPILYLRAFTEDERSVDAQSSGIGGKWVGEAFNQETLIQFEDALVGRLSRYGPVIAIAEPGAIPTGSASRAYFGDDWQHRVLQWMARAKLVVVVAGNSPGVRWELQQVVARDLLSKTILVLPPTDASSRNWPELWQACLGTPWQAAVPCLKQPAIRAAYVARDGRAVCFKSEKGNNLGYGLAIEFAIFGVKLRDAYHRRGAP